MISEKLPLRRRALGLIPAVAGLFGGAGYGRTAPAEPPDEAVARKTLEQALDAWRDGVSIESLKNASPPLVVKDRNWSQGDQLTKFEIEGAGTPWATERKFHIKLWLKNGQKKEAQDACNYAVGTNPVATVFRLTLE